MTSKEIEEINLSENKKPHPALHIVKLYRIGCINLLEATHRFSFLSGLKLEIAENYLLNVPRENIIFLRKFDTKQKKIINKENKMPKGRPSKTGKELKFKTVAVPLETYKMITELAEHEERSIARQLGVVIRNAHNKQFNANEHINKI